MSQSIDTKKSLLDDLRTYLIRYHQSEFPDFLVTRASGSYIYDDKGRAILDFTSGQMCATLGHNHPAVLAAMQTAMQNAIHLFSSYFAPIVVELARELAAILPPTLSKMAFPNTGAESNELAIRLAKMATGRFEIVALASGWAGQTAAASSATFYGKVRKGYGPAMPGTYAIPNPNCYRCPIKHCKNTCDMTCLDVGFEMIDVQTTSTPAAILVEPIQSGAGIIVPPEGYFKRMKKYCEERGMLLIFDEAQTSFRTGTNFAFEQEGIIPDIVTASKTIGAGIPLAITITSPEIERMCFEREFIYYTSHISDPLPAYVGLAVIKTIQEEDFNSQAREKGARIMAGLKSLQEKYEIIGDIRGRGLLIGIEFVKDRITKQPALNETQRIVKKAFELGLSINLIHERSSFIRMGPPLTVSNNEIDLALDILEQAIREVS